MIQILFDVIFALFAVIGVFCVCNELAKIFELRKKIGKTEMTVFFDDDADKRTFINEMLNDCRLELTIKVPAESLSDFDRAELDDLIMKGKVVLF